MYHVNSNTIKYIKHSQNKIVMFTFHIFYCKLPNVKNHHCEKINPKSKNKNNTVIIVQSFRKYQILYKYLLFKSRSAQLKFGPELIHVTKSIINVSYYLIEEF